jgi:hypothetical protein
VSTQAELLYFLASVLFILGIRGLTSAETARRGVLFAELGMAAAVVGTLMNHEIVSYRWILVSFGIGSAIGIAMAALIPMTKMPERIALSHAFGGLATALVGLAESQVAAAALTLAQRFLGAHAAAYYEPDGQSLRLVAHVGAPAAMYAPAESLAARAFTVGNLQAARPGDTAAEAVLAAPVPSFGGGRGGVLVIRELPFERLSASANELLLVLARLTGEALDRTGSEVRVEIRDASSQVEAPSAEPTGWTGWREAV